METATNLLLLPDAYRIVLAMRMREDALHCAKHLSQAGYGVVLCPEAVTAEAVIETVREKKPRLLIIDADIEWAEGVPVALRLYADSQFAALHYILLLRSPERKPDFIGYAYSRFYSYMSKPFYSQNLLELVRHKFETITAGQLPTVPISPPPAQRTADEWQEWLRQLPPFALFEAAWTGDLPRIERLLARGVDINAQNWLRKTALHLAVQRRREPTIHFLLDAGAEIDAQDCYGNTPLRLSFGELTLMRLLLERGANPNIASTNGETPLESAVHIASFSERYREHYEMVVSLLLSAGADPNLVAALNYLTPLQRAQKCHLTEIERLLRLHGAQQ